MEAGLIFLSSPLLLVTCPKHVFSHARNETQLCSLVLKHVFLFALFAAFIYFYFFVKFFFL
jgi:hypothetical protein